jgi:catechol 2,3-dioxygenase-like lactoylglutathione lyase family enzyme
MQTTLSAAAVEPADQNASPLRVRELNHVAIHVRDLAASKRFYGETLELPPLPRPDFGFDGAWYALGAQELHLIIDTEHQGEPRHSVHFALEVADAYSAHAELERRGVPIVHKPNPRPDGAVQVFFRDPDGYLIEMVSR